MPVDMETVSTLVGMESIPMEDMVTMASTLEVILPVVFETQLELEATRLILVRTSNCSMCSHSLIPLIFRLWVLLSLPSLC